ENGIRGVIELASFAEFSDIHLSFLDQAAESIGIVLTTIASSTRSEELLRARAARAEAEAGLARLRQVVDVMPEGIVIADAQGNVYLSNAAAGSIMGVVAPTLRAEDDTFPVMRQLDGTICRPDDQPLA